MSHVTRKATREERLELLPCPFCGGDVLARDCVGDDTFQKLIDEQVRRDLARGFMVGESVTGKPSDAPRAAAIMAEQQFKRPSQTTGGGRARTR